MSVISVGNDLFIHYTFQQQYVFSIFSTNESQSLNINLIYDISQKIVGDALKYFNRSCTKEKKPAQTNSSLLFSCVINFQQRPLIKLCKTA